MTLTEFLLARIAEDETAALPFRDQLGVDDVWRCDDVGGKVRSVRPQHFGNSDVMSESDTHLTAAHIARHDPARVLAQCAAKRRIVVAYEEMRRDVYGDEWEEGRALGVRYALRMLAQPYMEHPDFKPGWAA